MIRPQSVLQSKMFCAKVITRGRPPCYISLILILLLVTARLVIGSSQEKCPTEVSLKAISVKWSSSLNAENVVSDPICYNTLDEQLVTRNCSSGNWSPPLENMPPCTKVVNHYDVHSCPPGYYKISENSTDFCFRLCEPSKWDFPCYKSGGASTITDLNSEEVNSLLESLKQMNVSQYYWLPARRQKLFNPVVWTIPGPNWIKKVKGVSIPFRSSIVKNCLLLDITNRIIITEKCNLVYPSLCFYINDINYPSKCPKNYQSLRFMPDDGVCFGVEYSTNENGSSFQEFLKNNCKKPMGNYKALDFTRFIFKNMASTMSDLQDHEWCWFLSKNWTDNDGTQSSNLTKLGFQGTINKNGSLSLMRDSTRLSCMACEKEITYGTSEFILEYNNLDKNLYLTVYLPSSLWKYEKNDDGVRCYSNALGFIKAVDIHEITDGKYHEVSGVTNDTNVDKVVYLVKSLTDRIAQYWCEGHSKNFSLISTEKVIANPQGDNQLVYALCVNFFNTDPSANVQQTFSNVTNTLVEIFNVRNIVAMDILNFTSESAIIVYHIHVIANTSGNEPEIIQTIFNDFEETAKIKLPMHNIDLVNISSSMYCLPTESQNTVILDWELTPIGQIAVPKQFCLQKNGLPVKRRCGGSFLLGAKWEPVDGYCNYNYQPSNTTNFLYQFVKGLGPKSWTEHFMTHGLRYVLNDVDIIIPADIYYLSVSLKQIIAVAQANRSSLDMGDLENIAWIVDRLMVLNNQYLNLAQTLNSTNVILDSITDLIEILAFPNKTQANSTDINDYQIAVKPQFITQITYPRFNNVTGLALIKNKDSDLFTDMIIQPICKNFSIDNIINIQNLEIATWLPDEVLQSLSNGSNITNGDDEFVDKNMHVLINVFYNDAIFQEVNERNQSDHLINSRIVEIKIPGYKTPQDFSIHLVFKVTNSTARSNFCGYWNFHTGENGGVCSHWKQRGCYLVTIINGLVVCKCYHLTHFAQLISQQRYGNQEEDSLEHSRVLNIITLFGSFLSLLGIAGIWITAMVFTMWRQKAGTKVLLQLTIAIALPLILMIFFSLDNTVFIEVNNKFVLVDRKRGICIGLGALLHYSILAGFVWMLITAVLQFIRYVRVLGVRRPSRFMMKMSMVGWGVPTIPVLTVLLVDRNTYIPRDVSTDSYNSPLCYPTGIYFILAVLVPVGIIIIVNVILFLCVMTSIAKGPDGKLRSPDLDLVKAQLRLSIFLFFLLGLTWIFGIFSFSKNYVWSYMFCLTSTLQGFVLFLYFVICDPATRNLWITLMKPQLRSTGSRVSITSISHST